MFPQFKSGNFMKKKNKPDPALVRPSFIETLYMGYKISWHGFFKCLFTNNGATLKCIVRSTVWPPAEIELFKIPRHNTFEYSKDLII
jgi:hypothetical protein